MKDWTKGVASTNVNQITSQINYPSSDSSPATKPRNNRGRGKSRGDGGEGDGDEGDGDQTGSQGDGGEGDGEPPPIEPTSTVKTGNPVENNSKAAALLAMHKKT